MPYFVSLRSCYSILITIVLVSNIEGYNVGLKPSSKSEKHQAADFLSQQQPSNKTQGSTCEPHQLFHNETQACYDNGLVISKKTVPDKKNAPCGELMSLYESYEGSPFGVCGCIRSDDFCTFELDFHRPVLNWPKLNRCYFAYEQGPCKRGEWLVLNKTTFKSECSPNPCLNIPLEKVSDDLRSHYDNPQTDIFHFLRNGTCYQTFTRAYCGEAEYARFAQTDPVPKCLSRFTKFGRPCSVAVGTTPPLPCPQGHKRVGNDCTPIADFQ